MHLGQAGSVRLHGRGAVFLASDDGAYVTGVELFLDGGVTHLIKCVEASQFSRRS
jgi:hypothetical protein